MPIRSLRTLKLVLLLALLGAGDAALGATPSRDAVREELQRSLTDSAPRLGAGVVFREAQNNRFRYVALLPNQRNMEALEILVDVTESDTLTVRAYPKLRGGYVGLKHAAKAEPFLLELARMSGRSFFGWALDADDDLVVTFVITLESGFPPEAFDTVLQSLRNVDGQFEGLVPLLGKR